jgi:hypothetical protein
MTRVIPRQWVNMQSGELTMEALRYLDDIENSQNADSPGINTVLAGVNAIIAGTQPLTDVLITGLGSVTSVVNAQNTNIGTVTGAASGGALVATTNKAGVFGSRVGVGSVTTATVTVTASGGTGPYTYAWTNVSGDTFTVTAPTGATTAFQTTVTLGQDKSGVYRCTVTDSLAATYTVDVAVSVAEIS